ncbi:MAG: T9SS type A sorting domain-containing protein [candidate division KSB1 bacterium]|nr:T9SS type A sorting domain-containing protein [candidate division KSB1 bacterium]
MPAGDTFVKEAIILPETQNQEDQNLGLLGTMTLLMGSQIGMPSLFNTETGRAGVGRWGLMDQGSFNYNGLIPAHPCAWTKLYMGWEEPVVANAIDEIEIGSFSTQADHLIKIPISSREYFLLENRQRDPNNDRLSFGRDEQGRRAQFDSTFSIAVESGLGVITRVDEYDFALPGSGILIWHIDERVIEENLASNTINNDIDHRGVDLVECDGPQDIGQRYGMFTPGYGTESGDYWDPYWDDNISHKYVNGEKPVEFSSTSIPSSNAYGQARTFIRISEFSSRDTLMTCRISNDLHVPGFPQYADSPFGPGALRWLNDRAESGNGVISAVSRDGKIYAWNRDGKLIDNDESATFTDYTGRSRTLPVALAADLQDSLNVAPLSFDYDADGFEDLVLLSRSGHVTVWSLNDRDDDGIADTLAAVKLDHVPTSAVISGDKLLVGTLSGAVYWINLSFNLTVEHIINVCSEPISHCHVVTAENTAVFTSTAGQIYAYQMNSSPPEPAWQSPLAGNGDAFYSVSVREKNGQLSLPLAVLSNDGALTLIDSQGNVYKKTEPNIAFTNNSPPALSDLDADSIPEIIFADARHLGAYDWTTGVPVMNFPKTFSQENPGGYAPSPVCLKNGLIVLATSNGLLRVFDSKGEQRKIQPLQGPLTAGGPLRTEPVLAGNVFDETVLFALSEDGFLNAYGLSDMPATWAQYGGNAKNQFSMYFETSANPAPEDKNILSKAFCYPNPARGSETFIRFRLQKRAEQVSLRIYDIAGDLLTEIQQVEAAAGDNEIRWELDQVQSGAYIARLQVDSSTETRVKFIKIAVIK